MRAGDFRCSESVSLFHLVSPFHRLVRDLTVASVWCCCGVFVVVCFVLSVPDLSFWSGCPTMTILAQLHDCHGCNDERSIVQKKSFSSTALPSRVCPPSRDSLYSDSLSAQFSGVHGANWRLCLNWLSSLLVVPIKRPMAFNKSLTLSREELWYPLPFVPTNYKGVIPSQHSILVWDLTVVWQHIAIVTTLTFTTEAPTVWYVGSPPPSHIL